jgi:hypothetical protein
MPVPALGPLKARFVPWSLPDAPSLRRYWSNLCGAVRRPDGTAQLNPASGRGTSLPLPFRPGKNSLPGGKEVGEMGHHHHHRCEPMSEPVMPVPGPFGPGGVGFWVFLLILALLGIAWAEGLPGAAAA